MPVDLGAHEAMAILNRRGAGSGTGVSRPQRIAALAFAVLVLVVLVVTTFRVASSFPAPDGDGDGAETGTFLDEPAEHLGEISYDGRDYAKVLAGEDLLLVCDEEADSNVVKAIFDVDGDAGDRSVEISDRNGADGTCTSAVWDGLVRRHRVCERNHLFWRCGNWQTGS